jgi:capsular polysaccharide biosynthesis protein
MKPATTPELAEMPSSSSRLERSVLTSPPDTATDRFDIRSELLILWRWRRIIISSMVVAVVLATVTSLMTPRVYQATATVFVNAPVFSDDKQPLLFSVEAYERLAGSEFIHNQLAEKLRADNVIATTSLSASLKTDIYPSREPGKPYLPLVGLTVEAESPRMAQLVANTWANLFVVEGQRLNAVGKSEAVDFVLDEFPKSSNRVSQAERALKDVQDKHDEMMATLKAATAVDLKESRARSLDELTLSLEEQLFNANVESEEARRSASQLEAELKTMSPYIDLTKSISDEAVWQTMGRPDLAGSSTLPESVVKNQLHTQEENKAYTQLSQALAEARVRRAALTGRVESLRAQIAATGREAAAVRTDFLHSQAKVDSLDRLQKVDEGAYERTVTEASAQFEKLAERVGDAQMAKADRQSRLQIAGLAPLPERSESRRSGTTVGVAALLGFCVSAIVVWVLAKVRALPPTG